MKRLAMTAAALTAIALASVAAPQDATGPNAVEWQWSAQPVKGAEARVYELRFTGRIPDGYIVYASDFSIEIGPRPTRLRLQDTANVTTRGPLLSTGAHSKKDPAFKGEYRYFEGLAQLAQQVVVKDGATHVSGALVGQTCREADGTCSLFNQKFEVALP